MEINLNCENFKKALSAIQSICQRKTISDSTQNTLIEIENNNIIIKATDIEIFVEIIVEIESIKKDDNNDVTLRVLINAKVVFEIIKEIEDQNIILIFQEKACKIISEKSKVELNIFDSESFPQNEFKTENILSIKNKDIIETISYCAPLSTPTLQRSGTASILFEIDKENFIATATDGHCLSHIRMKKKFSFLEKSMQFLLSKKSASDIKKIIETLGNSSEELFLGKSGTSIILTGEKFTISTKTLNEKFPDYKKIINAEYKNEIECNRNSFIKITKRLSIFTENKFIAANIKIDKEGRKIYFLIENNIIGKTKEEIDITIIREDNFNIEKLSIFPPYLLKAASEINTQTNLRIKINEQQKPILFYSEDEEMAKSYIVMPMIAI